jgi:uncharacterized protein
MKIRANMAALFAGAAFLAVTTSAFAQEIEVSKTNRTIAVSTTDSATADADTAIVHIGYQLYGPSETAAYANASHTSNAIMKALTDAGVKKEFVESTGQNINHVQPFEIQNLPEAQKEQRQFTVTQSWDVKTSAKDAAAVLSAAIQAGANQGGAIDWTIADEDALEAQAAGKALKRASDIATRMAQGLNAKLGPLVYASNQMPQTPRPMPIMAKSMMMDNALATRPVPPLAINAQKVTRSATVYAVFAIE